METEKVTPDAFVVGERILMWTTEADVPNGPRHYEVRTVRLIEPPDNTHPDAYDFEFETPGTDPSKFTAGVRVQTDGLVERVISALPISEPWVQRGP